MIDKSAQIRFLLNDRLITLNDVAPTDTLLDFLRLNQRLRGTKEGCAEGDCGACTVLIGRLFEGRLIYETVNSCIRFLGSLNGCHIVTVEHLKDKDGALNPVQQAMVDCHGSQCGFCTPGIVMSLYALWMQNPQASDDEIDAALQGNLCRCTGYEPIVKAAKTISSYGDVAQDRLAVERDQVIAQLKSLAPQTRIEIERGGDLLIVPHNLDDFAKARDAYPNATIVAGSTDVGLWVTKQFRQISPVIFINHLDELRHINVKDGHIHIGAGVSYSDLIPIIEDYMPQAYHYWMRIGGDQVRNMGTIGGNIANGSPIGDTPPMLIALGATVTLRKGSERRTLPLEKFFIDYGKQDRQDGDFVETIAMPIPKPNSVFRTYKISKRRDEDISAVTMAIYLTQQDQTIKSIKIAMGGMAGIPKRAHHVEQSLVGKPLSEETFKLAASHITDDFAPLSDWRASSTYRTKIAQNLLQRFYLEHLQDETFTSLDQINEHTSSYSLLAAKG